MKNIAKYIAIGVVLVIVIFIAAMWFKNGRMISAKADQASLDNSVSSFLDSVSSDNKFDMSSAMRSAQERASIAASNAQIAQAEYINAIKNDPPWYLEFTDGILWWDKKKTTERNASNALLDMQKEQYNYERLRATDAIFNNSKNRPLTLLEKIGEFFNNLLYAIGLKRKESMTQTQNLSGHTVSIEQSSDSYSLDFKPLIIIIIILIILLLIGWRFGKKQIRKIARHYRRKIDRKAKDIKKDIKKRFFHRKKRRKKHHYEDNDEDDIERYKKKHKDYYDIDDGYVPKRYKPLEEGSDFTYWLRNECDKAGLDMDEVLRAYKGRSDRAFVALYEERKKREQYRRK